jgi:hypothetical protein
MKLNILVFDDNLGAMLEEISDGLRTYLGREIKVPDFKVGENRTLFIPAMQGHSSVELAFHANSYKVKSGVKIAEQIRNGDFNATEWDAVIVDNNWNTQKLANADGCAHILPALLESPHFKASNPEYLLFTWHFNDDAHHSSIRAEIVGLRSAATVRPIAKGDKYQLSQWFGEMIVERFAKRLGQVYSSMAISENRMDEKAGNGKEKHIVEVEENGGFTVNGKPTPKKPGPHIHAELHTCLLFLFFLSREDIPVERTRDVMDCNVWLKERLEGKPAKDCLRLGVAPEISERLKKVKSFNKELVFTDDIKAGVAGKAWNAFRKHYPCGVAASGAAGNAPQTILRSINVDKFEMPLTNFTT